MKTPSPFSPFDRSFQTLNFHEQKTVGLKSYSENYQYDLHPRCEAVSPRATLRFAQRTYRTRLIIVGLIWFMTEKKHKANSAEGRCSWKIPEESRREFLTLLPTDSHGAHLILQQQAVTTCDMSSTRVFTGDWSHGRSSPRHGSKCQAPRWKAHLQHKKTLLVQ